MKRKKIIVIGAGFAGISASVHFALNNYDVEIIESNSKPGGRAYSFTDKDSNLEIDNSQHLLLGCYNNTFELLKKINSFHLLKISKQLTLPFN